MSDFKPAVVDEPQVLDEKNSLTDGASPKDSSEISSRHIVDYEFDPKQDRRLTAKIDLKLIPILGMLYLICFLDRTNIANAKIAGLEKGLHMPSNGYNTALWIFYLPFVLFEIPSNWIMSMPQIKPNLWLGGQTLILGILAMCQGLSHTYHGLLGIRFLMGIVETGLPAGAGLLIASYYRKSELSLRFALFFAFGQSGSCFSGLLAYAIQGINGFGGKAGWQWIFIIEGIITIVFSIFVFIFCPHFPARDSWLKESDRSRLLARLEADKGKEATVPAHWMRVLFSYKIWIMTLLFFCADMSAGSISSFNPTILSQLGWTSRRAQVMTIPVWIAGIVSALSASLISGRINKRWPFLLTGICVSVVGWVLHFKQVQPASVRYFAQFLISIGTFTCMPIYIGMLTANLRGRAYQSMGTALQLGLGNCANFISSNVFISKQAPKYPVGFGTGLGITAFSFPVMVAVIIISVRHNKKIDAKRAALGPGEELDDQVDYRYVF